MPFNISNFRSDGLRFGGARPSYFEVNIFAPLDIQGAANPSSASQRTSMLVEAASLPGVTNGKIEVSYFGRRVKYTGDKTYDDWTVTIMNDEDFALRSMFEKWSDDMNAAISNRMNPTMLGAKYKSNAVVKQYGRDGTVIRSYELQGLFPVQISDIELNWGEQNSIEKFRVQFAYDLWVPVIQGAEDNYDGILPPDGASGG